MDDSRRRRETLAGTAAVLLVAGPPASAVQRGVAGTSRSLPPALFIMQELVQPS
jgi:hypothetical protein